ncbi:MAG TPA: hypothetical protein VKB38_02955 [Terracidiphilus sp.]|nr:hypothetical protein [Terracidiphilus sp.]
MPSSTELTSLFQSDVRPTLGRRVSPFFISCVLHYFGIGLVSYVLLHAPAVVNPNLRDHYSMRHLDLRAPSPSIAHNDPTLYPRVKTNPVQKTQARKAAPDSHPSEKPAARAGDNAPKLASVQPAQPRPVPAVKIASGQGEGKQTLVQPTVKTHTDTALNLPLPAVMIWTPEKTQTQAIVAPKPAPPTTSDVDPSLDIPNEELKLASLNVAAVDKPSPVPAPTPGTTTPIAVKGPDMVKMAPATVSSSENQPTPTSVLSISDLRVEDGSVVLPPANETLGDSKSQGGGSPQSNGSLESSKTLPAGSGGTGQGAPGNGADPAAAATGASSTASDAGLTVDHIELPPDGKFGVVVVGSSLTEQYPEIMQIWSDRVAYTAYLHVGLPKTWILQYAQLRSSDASGEGSVAHIDAPWPFDIFRPNLLAADVNADALMVHGILDSAGRLESLNIAFPDDFPHASFVLAVLKRWQFRPALQQGKATPVEVLLIIPEEAN